MWAPSYSHSPSGSTRLGTARKGAHTAQEFQTLKYEVAQRCQSGATGALQREQTRLNINIKIKTRDKPSSERVYRESMQREAARKSGAIGAPFQTKARRSVKGADRPSGHKRATSMALGPCTANAASMALGPTRCGRYAGKCNEARADTTQCTSRLAPSGEADSGAAKTSRALGLVY